MSGLLFIIAPEADNQAISRVLLHLRDWEYDSGDRFKLVNTKNAYDLDDDLETSPPIPVGLENSWAGAPLEDVEAYCLDLDRNDLKSANPHLYLVVDSQGLQDQTCILGERACKWEEDPITYADHYKKMRLPWEEAYLTWCNLDISNMNFEEFTEEADVDYEETITRRWWTYRSVNSGPDLSDEKRQERDRELDRLRSEST